MINREISTTFVNDTGRKGLREFRYGESVENLTPKRRKSVKSFLKLMWHALFEVHV